MNYQKIGFRDGPRLRSVFLRVLDASGAWVRGYEVDETGREIVPSGGADRRLRIIAKGAIVSSRPCVMDKHYGKLIVGKPVLNPSGPYSTKA